MDGAGGLVGANYLGEVGPRDGTMAGYLTGTAWTYAIDPGAFRVDFKSYEFVGYQPGNAVYYVRTDTPPGMKDARPTSCKAKGLVAGGLAADSVERHADPLAARHAGHAVQIRHRLSLAARRRGSRCSAARSISSRKSPPSYFGVVEPSMVKTGQVDPALLRPDYDGQTSACRR